MTPPPDPSDSLDARMPSSTPLPETSSDSPLASPAENPVRWMRTALIGVPLIVLNSYWIANSEMKTGVTEITVSALFMGVLFLLLLLVGGNALLRRTMPRAALTSAELLVLYVMLTMSSSVAGVGAIGFLLPFLGNVTWFAPQNGWTGLAGSLPRWLLPTSPQALSPFYLGNDSIFHPVYLRAWAIPLLFWGLLFFTALFTTLCLASLLRAQWVDSEHLPFPTTLLPVEMTRGEGGFFLNRLLWWGFGLPFAIQSLNSLNSLFASIPSWPINHLQDVHAWFPSRPWNGVDAILIGLHPSGLGLAFVTPLDMSFSMWFFYLLKKSLNVAGVAAGWRDPDLGWDGDGSEQFPFVSHMAWGAWIALALNSFWMARHHLRGVFRRALHGDPGGLDDGELFSSRMTVGGLLLGFVVLCGLCRMMSAPLWIPILYFALYLMLMTVLCRVVAEVGPPSISLDWGTPQEILSGILGTHAIPAPGLTTMAALSWFNLDYRAAAMPHQLAAMKIGAMGRFRLQPLGRVMLFALAVAIPVSMLCDLQMYYANGAATAKVNSWRIDTASSAWGLLDYWQKNPHDPNPLTWTSAAAGAVLLLGMAGLRGRILGFPLHPAAFSLICTFSMDAFWVDFFLGWLFKMLLLHYGGMRAYRAALPFFLGLVLGDFTAGAGWSLVGTFLHLNLYRTFPT